MNRYNSINAAARALRAGEVNSVQLAQECLARISDPTGEGARVFLHVDAQQVLADARKCDAAIQNGETSLLCGIPISVKDLFDVEGQVTTVGSRILANEKPATKDATAIARLRAAGAVLMGRTNMTEFAFSGIGMNPHYGTPLSPYNRSVGHVPGGSTAGGAVSVSDQMAMAAIGSDTGGSTRIPAAFCNIVGYRPTAERIPQDGVFPLAHSFDSVGAMAQTVGDCALLDRIMSASNLKAPNITRPVLGLASGHVLGDLDATVSQAYERAVVRLSHADFELKNVQGVDWSQPGALLAEGRISAFECYESHHALLKYEADMDQRVAKRIRAAEGIPKATYEAALQKIMGLRTSILTQIAAYDAIVLPTVACIPPVLVDLANDEAFFAANTRVLRNTLIANVLNFCAITIPINDTGEAPVGLMLMAPAGSDAKLFAIAEHVESVLNNARKTALGD